MESGVAAHFESVASDQPNTGVVLIRGAPGIGKSTLAEILRSTMKGGAVIDIDDIRRMICDERFVYKENVHYLNAVGVVGDLVRKLSELGCRPVVVVDVFAVEALRAFIQAMRDAEIFVISLYADDNILLDRMKARHNGYVNVDVARSVNQHIFETRRFGNAWLDIGTLPPMEICKKLLNFIPYDT
jgi:broad-specificity NMP kinase